MNIFQILKPTKSKLLLFVLLFTAVNLFAILIGVVLLLTGFVLGNVTVGFPISFVTLKCGYDIYPSGEIINMVKDSTCQTGINFQRLVLNAIFWYGIAVIIGTIKNRKRIKTI